MIVEVNIQGRVQGVWFRAWTYENAKALGLRGWVKNCGDGSVAALFEGPDEAVEQMLKLCHEGPELAHVSKVDVTKIDISSNPRDFRII